MKHRTNIRLDEQAKEDARTIMKEHGLGSVSAAIRFALRVTARVKDTELNTVAPDREDKSPHILD